MTRPSINLLGLGGFLIVIGYLSSLLIDQVGWLGFLTIIGSILLSLGYLIWVIIIVAPVFLGSRNKKEETAR